MQDESRRKFVTVSPDTGHSIVERVMDVTRGESTFEDEFPRLFEAAYRVTHRILGNDADAEDAAAEALARALRAWRRIGGLAHRDAWVLRVAANVALDNVRRGSAPALTLRPVLDPAEVASLRLALVAALGALSRRQREVIALRYLADQNEADVAASLGISVNSVKKHAQRGLSALRTRLGPDWQEVHLALD